MASSPVKAFEQLHESSDFLFIVYYRGHWCPFCMAHLRELESISPEIKAAGGAPLIVTSQTGDDHLSATRSSTGYSGEAIVDPANELVAMLKERGLVDVAVSKREGYEHGMAQPAVLVLGKEGKVWEKWAIVPSMMNIGGASDRPSLKQVWQNADAKMKGKETVHKKYSKLGAWKLFKSMCC